LITTDAVYTELSDVATSAINNGMWSFCA